MTGVPALLGALGGVALVFGLVNFVLAASQGSVGFDQLWIAGNLLIGVGLLVASAVMGLDSLRERLHTREAQRAGKYGTSAILTTVLGIAILVMIGWVANRYPQRFDLTESRVHSLSDQSLKVLKGLEEPVSVTVLYPKLQTDPIRELLDRYAYETERFQVRYFDPNERPDVARNLEIDEEELGQGVVHVALGGESTLITEPTEENVTNAMVKLSRTGVKKVYFLEGHNERAVQGEGADARTGYGRVADALGNENYQVETLLLAATGAVPDDADVVVVAGATRPLLAEEREALNAYLERGGALLALVDPRAKTDLVEDLRSWGVEIGEDVVIDRQLALFGRATSPFAGRYDPDHAITRGMRETTLFHVARSVSGAEDSDFTEIVFTGENSWAERDLARFYADGEAALEAEDLAGPVPIAVAGTPRLSSNGSEPDAGDPQAVEGEEAAADGGGEDAAPQARLVVFGDADFPTNEYIEAYRNRDLFLNTVNWLLGDVEAISIRPARSRASRLQLSNDQFIRIRTLSLFLVPQAIAVAGVIVWWRRRFTPAG